MILYFCALLSAFMSSKAWIRHMPPRYRAYSPLMRASAASVLSDSIAARKFHHVEFYAGDATLACSRFISSLGADMVAKSDISSGNSYHASYVIQSGNMRMLFTAPYAGTIQPTDASAQITAPYASTTNADSSVHSAQMSLIEHKNSFLPGFDSRLCSSFFALHGFAVRAVAIEVDDVCAAYHTMLNNTSGAVEGVLAPTRMLDQQGRGYADMAEVCLYGDVVLRIVNLDHYKGTFLPNFEDLRSKDEVVGRFGIQRFDHIVGNVPALAPIVQRMQASTGFHRFAEFAAEDVGTMETGLNSVVLASGQEHVLLPLNEPVYAHADANAKKSQILTYLEQNQGPGVQHLALLSSDIFHTLQQLQASYGGLSLLPPPSASYYAQLKERIGPRLAAALSPQQLQLAQEYGVLLDAEGEGLLLQVFTKPVADRPTVFLEIIQRIGCDENKEQRPGCGGFGKGNFKALFQSIEELETSLGINQASS